jgi:anion-transporting  ArsA/GET3 family ATPase
MLDPRLLIVTGKGGVGKSTVCAALAVAAARTGQRTCLVEVEGRQTFSHLFETAPWDFTEREFRPGLWGLSIDPEASLAQYLAMFYGARRLSKLVIGSTAVEFATAAAPGIKDVLLIGKVKEMERRRDSNGRFAYDLIVVDAPPTGRIVRFLRAPEATTELVTVGPIRAQAQDVIDLILDPTRTHVQLVTLLEEMPVAETVQAGAALHQLGVTLGPLLVNCVLPERFDEQSRKALRDDLYPAELAAVLREAGPDPGVGDSPPYFDEQAAKALRDLGAAHLERLALQRQMREALDRALDLPTLELPYVYSAEFGPQAVSVIARVIEEAVAEPGGGGIAKPDGGGIS